MLINGKTAGFSNKQLFLEVQKANIISVILIIWDIFNLFIPHF